MSVPYLTEVRWNCLWHSSGNRTWRRPFLAKELKVQGRNGVLRPSTGPTPRGLKKAGGLGARYGERPDRECRFNRAGLSARGN